MEIAGRYMDGLSLHYYTVPRTWQDKGSATIFQEDEWFAVLKKTLFMDELITKHAAIMDRYDPEKRVALVVDEWGTWYDVEPGTHPRFLYQQNTLRDALAAALNLNIFHHHCDRVRMANIAQTVNVLQAMVLTQDEKMILTPTYHVFHMFQVHQGATYLPIALECGTYTWGNESIPAVHASASRNEEGVIHISLCNVNPHEACDVAISIAGVSPTQVSGRILTAETMQAHNTFEEPHRVVPTTFEGATVTPEGLKVRLPSKSVVILSVR